MYNENDETFMYFQWCHYDKQLEIYNNQLKSSHFHKIPLNNEKTCHEKHQNECEISSKNYQPNDYYFHDNNCEMKWFGNFPLI